MKVFTFLHAPQSDTLFFFFLMSLGAAIFFLVMVAIYEGWILK